jgi:hypothetical protein
MKKRLLKALSVPVCFAIMIPAIIYQTIRWVIVGKKDPLSIITDYLNWLENKP